MMNALVLIAAMSMQGAGEPMPLKTDIPSDFATVICPTDSAARTMLDQYYGVKPAPRNHTIDIDLFFQGLKATGCVQDSPHSKADITIRQAVARRTIKLATNSETVLLYRGVSASGVPLVGIVDETSNNKHPRTDFERWLAEWAPGGLINYTPTEMGPVYSCPTIDSARAAVKAIPVKGSDKVRATAFAKARTANGCRQAPAGQYRVTARYENREIQCGFECYDDWNALAATDAKGKPVALIFDGSHF